MLLRREQPPEVIYIFSLLTCPHTATFTLLRIFSPLEMSSINTVLALEMFSSGCRPNQVIANEMVIRPILIVYYRKNLRRDMAGLFESRLTLTQG